jgi:hypothetical protein
MHAFGFKLAEILAEVRTAVRPPNECPVITVSEASILPLPSFPKASLAIADSGAHSSVTRSVSSSTLISICFCLNALRSS